MAEPQGVDPNAEADTGDNIFHILALWRGRLSEHDKQVYNGMKSFPDFALNVDSRERASELIEKASKFIGLLDTSPESLDRIAEVLGECKFLDPLEHIEYYGWA